MDIQVGKVAYYYDKIGVAVIEVFCESLKVGDTIKISGREIEFTQTITTLQKEHLFVSEAEAGESVGVKVIQTVHVGDMVYLVSHE